MICKYRECLSRFITDLNGYSNSKLRPSKSHLLKIMIFSRILLTWFIDIILKNRKKNGSTNLKVEIYE